jgi:hypothetical protein
MPDLIEVGRTSSRLGLLFHARHNRKQYRDENRDDGDDDKEFYERKSSIRSDPPSHD